MWAKQTLGAIAVVGFLAGFTSGCGGSSAPSADQQLQSAVASGLLANGGQVDPNTPAVPTPAGVASSWCSQALPIIARAYADFGVYDDDAVAQRPTTTDKAALAEDLAALKGVQATAPSSEVANMIAITAAYDALQHYPLGEASGYLAPMGTAQVNVQSDCASP